MQTDLIILKHPLPLVSSLPTKRDRGNRSRIAVVVLPRCLLRRSKRFAKAPFMDPQVNHLPNQPHPSFIADGVRVPKIARPTSHRRSKRTPPFQSDRDGRNIPLPALSALPSILRDARHHGRDRRKFNRAIDGLHLTSLSIQPILPNLQMGTVILTDQPAPKLLQPCQRLRYSIDN
jgi:hypothetical protein